MADIIQMPSIDKAPAPETTRRDAQSILKDAKELTKSLTSLYETNIKTTYHLDPSFIEESILFSFTNLEGYPDDKIREIYDKYYRGPEEIKLIEIKDIRDALSDAKSSANDVWQANTEYESLQKMYSDAVVEEFTNRNSKDNREKMLTRLENMKAEAANEDLTPEQKKDIESKISIMESMMSMDFMLKRISTITDKERTRVIDQFFSEKNGGYIIEKCKTKSPKFGFSEDWYKFFFDLEEKFCPEEYHIYNNLFLYGVMRFVGYCDPYSKEDRVYVTSLINSLIGILYHKFPDSAMEETVVHLIEAYDDYFVDYKEKFITDNTTRPGHPVREAAHAKREADRVKDLVASMMKFNIPVPEDENMSADDLQRYFNQKMEELVAENSKEKEKIGETDVTTDEDGVTTVKPAKRQEGIHKVNGEYYYYFNDGKHGTNEGLMYKLFVELDESLGDDDRDEDTSRFFLKVMNPDVRTDLFEPVESYTEDERKAIYREASRNIWYFLRFCVQENPIRTQEDLAYVNAFKYRSNIFHKTINQRNNYVLLQYIAEWQILFDREQISGYDMYDGINVIANSTSVATNFINSVYELESQVSPVVLSMVDPERISMISVVNRPSLTDAVAMPGRYLNLFLNVTRISWLDGIFDPDSDEGVTYKMKPLFINDPFIMESDPTDDTYIPTFDAVIEGSKRKYVWSTNDFLKSYDNFYRYYSGDLAFIYIEDTAPEMTPDQEELAKKIQEKFDTEGGIPVDKFIAGEVHLEDYSTENTAFSQDLDE